MMMTWKTAGAILAILAWGQVSLWAAEKDEKSSEETTILGEVPEGWEVVELSDAPLIEKWVELKNGEKRKILLRPFGLKPVADKDSKFTVSNPLDTVSGQKLSEVLETQNTNLSESEEELSVMLSRLKQLLLTLPTTTEEKRKS